MNAENEWFVLLYMCLPTGNGEQYLFLITELTDISAKIGPYLSD